MKDLTKGNIYKTFFWFAIPMVLSGVLAQGYNIVDTVIAGRLLGTSGLASVGATSALISVISALFWGYCTGLSIYLARCFGAKEYKKIKASLYSNTLAIFIVSVTVSAILILSKETIFDLLKVDPAVREGAKQYFVIYISGIFFVISNIFGAYIMNAFGIGDFPLYMSVLSSVLNISGNVLLVKVFDMRAGGLALATVFSAFVTSVFYMIKVKQCFDEMGVRDIKIKPSFTYVKDAFSISGAVMLQQVVMYFAPFLISPSVNAIGGAATAAYTVALHIYEINAEIYQNSSKALSNYTAQCVGAEKYKNIKKGIRVGLIQGIVFVAPSLLFGTLFAKTTCEIFFPKGESGKALEYAILFSRYYLPFLLFNLVNNLFHAFFRGVKALKPLILCTAFSAVVRLTVSLLLIPKFGMNGVYTGWAASWLLEAVLVVTIYFSGKWQSEKIREGLK